nr:immunoglobulin light chain junction region [Macaca mulatta]MOX37040.1 immunoglobulin light chain junction region [Macaca mulatta]
DYFCGSYRSGSTCLF